MNPTGHRRVFPRRRRRARELIEARLRSLQNEGEQLIVLASAAPGADILAHEVCGQANVPSTLCLPAPSQVVAREIFRNYDAWLPRFFDIVRARERNLLILGNDTEVPRWLRARGADPWERGNRWVVKLAQSWGADRVTLLALWDSDESSIASGGTAHMIRLARDTGIFSFAIIDSRELTKA